MRQRSILQIQRFLLLISFLVLIGLAVIVARTLGYGLPGEDGVPAQQFVWAVLNKKVALISGHAGFDSGAVCEDANGVAILKEADVVAIVVQRVAKRLTQAGIDVTILQEYDPQLQGLQADLLLSVHADSCIDATGYKAARGIDSQIPKMDDHFISCLQENYGITTQLTIHSQSITHNMTEYHAWHRIDPATPAGIIEIGFLGGDQELLTKRPAIVAKGITDGILCFLTNEAVHVATPAASS